MSTITPTTTGWNTSGKERTAQKVAEYYIDRVQGKVFLVTGAYSGIGVETVKALLAAGAKTVIIGGRNAELQQEFVDKLRREYQDERRIDGDKLIDLANLSSVQEFAKYVDSKYPTIDAAIFNAAVMNTPWGLTKNNIEQQFGVNVVGHFLLAKLLVHKTKRQVWLSSSGHKMVGGARIDLDALRDYPPKTSYNGWLAYQQSKLGDVLLAKEFSKRYPDHFKAVSVDPGTIADTNLSRHVTCLQKVYLVCFILIPNLIMGNVFFKTPQQGAATSVTCALLSDDEIEAGAYYEDCQVGKEGDNAKFQEDAVAVFDYCEELTKDFQ